MVLSAAERSDLVISKDNLEAADREVTELEKDMPHVFGATNREVEMTMAADLLDFLRSRGTLSRSQLYREGGFKIMSYDTFEKIMRSLIASNLVYQVDDGQIIKVTATNIQ
jgi:hypothetical protein